jgi:tetrahydromethanopterin S-methyltransferase subunit A
MEYKIVEAIDKDPYHIELDEVGYFVIKPDYEASRIYAKYYNYENELLCVIRGKDARSIYWTIIENQWVSDLSHAAYLGKELAFVEMAIRNGVEYVQE